MLLSAVSFLVVAQSSSEVPEGLMNNPVLGTNACTIVVNNVAHYSVSGQIIIHAISSAVI